jgi:peptide-methionine (R)-S-oxide reductase
MPTRRQFVAAVGAGLGLTPVLAWLGSPDVANAGHATTTRFPVEKSDQEWRAQLTPEQYRVLRKHGTERARTSPHNDEKRPGTFVCAGCGHLLFAAETKYESGTGWPSFWRPLEGAVGTTVDKSWFMVRTEVHCANCGGHLGHVFPDGPAPTGQRFCMNGVAMEFEPGT